MSSKWWLIICFPIKRPQIIETRAFPRIGYVLITGKTQVKIHFVLYLNFNWLFLNWCAWSSTVITADETHSNFIFLPHHHTISYHNNREAWALVHKIRNQNLGSCLRAPKERQKRGRAKTGLAKICFPNFPMKIKVAPFVFTNHRQSIKIILFL